MNTQRRTFKSGVRLGDNADFSGAKIRGVAGRNIIRGTIIPSDREGGLSGVEFVSGDFRNVTIEDVAGQDTIENTVNTSKKGTFDRIEDSPKKQLSKE